MHAAQIRAALEQGQDQLRSVNSTLFGFKSGLDGLEAQMLPIYTLTEKLRETQKNIDVSVSELRAVNENFTLATEVHFVLQQGPKYDQERYVKTMHKLLLAIEFLDAHRGYEGSGKALDQAKNVLLQAQTKCKSEFVNDMAFLLKYSLQNEPKMIICALELNEIQVLKTSQLLTCLLSTKLTPTGLLQECGEKRRKNIQDVFDKIKIAQGNKEGSQESITEYLDNIIYVIHAEKELVNRVFPNEDLSHAALSATIAPLLESLTANVKEEDAKDVFQTIELHYMFKSKSTLFRDVLQPPLRLREHPGIETTEPWKLVSIIGKIEEGLAATSRQKLNAFKQDISDTMQQDKHGLKDGNVHPISSKVMHFLRHLCDHVVALECLLAMDQTSNITYFVDSVVMKLMDALQAKATTSKCRNDLKFIFIANNAYYVATSLAQLALEFQEPSPSATAAIQQTIQPRIISMGDKAVHSFLEASYDSFETLLMDPKETLQYKSNGTILTLESGRILKDKFSRFNLYIEEICTNHKAYVVPDIELRQKLTKAAYQRIVLSYTNFFEKYSIIQFSKKNMDKYVKFKPSNVESMLAELFKGDRT
ncbi:hypothetical protein THRCLA_09766 [Thraustotheca clavata]|uniref:Exocyst subunit Exo70 family protein n=1 Tax=Thraustotheca clavata TaxID=74557 RepID=A0A1V9YUD1_9STRA|nr:hypothetical protein THRCLA_09766 [Thraustotheca clavata]